MPNQSTHQNDHREGREDAATPVSEKPFSKTAVYVRVSTQGQKFDSQLADIHRWLAGHGITDAEWFEDKETRVTLERPGLKKLRKAIFDGEIKTVVVWKLDRLAGNLRDGVNLVAEWCDMGVRVVSVTQQFDLKDWVGRLIASVLFALSEGEYQTKRERQLAGIAAAKRQGKRWGGSEKGWLSKKTEKLSPTICDLYEKGISVQSIASIMKIDYRTVDKILALKGLKNPNASASSASPDGSEDQEPIELSPDRESSFLQALDCMPGETDESQAEEPPLPQALEEWIRELPATHPKP